MKILAIIASVVAMGGGTATADPMEWTGAQLDHQQLDGGIAIERRSLSGMSGYTQLQLVAVVGDTRTLLVETYAMCDAVRRTTRGLEVERCVERFADTRETTQWLFANGTLSRATVVLS